MDNAGKRFRVTKMTQILPIVLATWLGLVHGQDIKGNTDVLKNNSSILKQKIGKFSVGEILFMVLAILTVVCFLISTILAALNDSLSSIQSRAAASVCTIFGCIFLICTCLCGCYLWHCDGCLSQCQKLCLALAVLLFTSFITLLVLEIYLKVYLSGTSVVLNGVTSYSGYSIGSYIVYYSTHIFCFLCFILYGAFVYTIYRQCGWRGPFTTCKITLIALTVIILLCFIMMAVILLSSYIIDTVRSPDYTNITFLYNFVNSYPAFITNCFLCIVALIGLSCYMGFFGEQFTPLEIAFGTLGILVILCFVALILFEILDPKHDETREERKTLLAIQFLLLVPFCYCAYRLGLFDSVISLFKDNVSKRKKSLHGTVEEPSDTEPPKCKSPAETSGTS